MSTLSYLLQRFSQTSSQTGGQSRGSKISQEISSLGSQKRGDNKIIFFQEIF